MSKPPTDRSPADTLSLSSRSQHNERPKDETSHAVPETKEPEQKDAAAADKKEDSSFKYYLVRLTYTD